MKVTFEDEFINCKYSEIRHIGRGSFGQVFLAKDKNTNSNVAIKYISFDGFDESERDKLLLEGQILFKITNKNIISFENFFYNKSRAILIMEYAEGGDLDKKIKAQMLVGPFKEEKIISWFLEICEAIKYLHQRHIIHRDLKPLNIFLTIDNKIKLNNQINNNLYEVSKQLLLKYLDENSNSEEVNINELLNVFTGKKNANETSPTGKYKFFSCAPESLLSDTYLYDGAAIIVAGNGAYTGRTRFYDGKFEL